MFKALIIDIETRPALGYFWNTPKTIIPVEFIIEDIGICCFSAAWAHEPKSKVMFYSDWKDGHKAMLRAAYRLLAKADAWVHYNGTSFDLPHFNTEFFKLGWAPTVPRRQVDMMKLVDRKFRFVSRKLAFVGPASNVGKKIENEGASLWRDVMNREPQALRDMEHYCRGDVILEKDLYKKMIPWFSGQEHPNVSMYNPECGERPLCTHCGGSRIKSHGWFTTNTYTYRSYNCLACGGWFKDRNSVRSIAKPLTIHA